ncbi:MAG: glycosyltransferase, partial [Actinomycetota bacterium]|nr:glycosyltransferase [Actinomycetota bacterium]
HLRVADAPEDFAAAVAELLEDRDAAARIARNGRELAAQRYSWSTSGERMAGALDAWLGPKLVSSPAT